MLPNVEGPKGSADAVLSGPKVVSERLLENNTCLRDRFRAGDLSHAKPALHHP